LSARYELTIPDSEELRALVLEEAHEWSRRSGGRNVRTHRAYLDRLVKTWLGLPTDEARRLAHGAIEDDGTITEEDLPEVMRTKFDLFGQDGVLSFEYDKSRFSQIGGFESLKRWLDIRKPLFTGELQKPSQAHGARRFYAWTSARFTTNTMAKPNATCAVALNRQSLWSRVRYG
jgi:hypothetical protein